MITRSISQPQLHLIHALVENRVVTTRVSELSHTGAYRYIRYLMYLSKNPLPLLTKYASERRNAE